MGGGRGTEEGDLGMGYEKNKGVEREKSGEGK